VGVFRRSGAGATDGTAQDPQGAKDSGAPANERPPASEGPAATERPAGQAGKGRPTPKRSEAERGRYQSIQGGRSSGTRTSTATRSTPATKEEKARDRDRSRSERNRRTEAMKRGEDWALGPRDKGPGRQLARDYIDAHRRPSEFYMFALVLLLIVLISRNKALNDLVSYLVGALVLVIVVDGLLVRRALRRLVGERLPGESSRGLTVYAMMRAMQIRRMRLPAPRLKPGDKF
jgi:hypothetical protein